MSLVIYDPYEKHLKPQHENQPLNKMGQFVSVENISEYPNDFKEAADTCFACLHCGTFCYCNNFGEFYEKMNLHFDNYQDKATGKIKKHVCKKRNQTINKIQ
jgi:hypothetical protein